LTTKKRGSMVNSREERRSTEEEGKSIERGIR